MKNYFLYIALFITAFSFGQEIIITEFHYQNANNDADEGVEIAGQALVASPTDLTNWSIVIYDGFDGTLLSSTDISGYGATPGQIANSEYIWVLISPMPDDDISPDVGGAIVLYDGTNVIDSWSYGGSFTATDGVANGTTFTDVTSTNVNAVQDPSIAKKLTLQLIDDGSGGFEWTAPITETPDAAPAAGLTLSVDINQIPGFNMYPNPVVDGNFVISSPNSVKKQVEIYTITCKKVFSKKVRNNEKINVSNLSTGLYFLRVYEEGKLATRKLLINN